MEVEEPETNSKDEEIHLQPSNQYIQNSVPLTLLETVRLDNHGGFVHSTPQTISPLKLIPELRDNEKMLAAAAKAYSVNKSNHIQQLRATGQKHRTEKLGQLVKLHLPKISNPGYAQYYRYILDNFGDMKIEDYINKVLNRFSYSDSEVDRIKDLDVKPSSIKPATEILLSNRLTRNNHLGIILKEIAEQNLSEVEISRIKDQLNENCQVMANKRKGKAVKGSEEDYETEKLMDIIMKLSQSAQGWHMISDDYLSFKILYNVMKDIRGNKTKVNQLVKTLFPEYRITTTNEGFVINISRH